MSSKKEAILVVSFGTSHMDTCVKTIGAIEDTIRGIFPDHCFYRAWTSPTIRKILIKRDGIQIDSIEEAFERMKAEQITSVTIQPSHMINGIENDELMGICQAIKNDFQELKIGTPLLTSQEDLEQLAGILSEQWRDLPENEALVFMGHGTPHYANFVYSALDYLLKDMGKENFFVGTVEGYPDLDTVIRKVGAGNFKRIHLTPLMIVAGDHAKNDMSGDEDDSWKKMFEKEGYEVICYLKGLGEDDRIREMFVEHVRMAK